MTKRHRQLAAQHADLVRKRTELAGEAHAIGDAAEQAKRLMGEDEKKRVAAILAELDDLAPQIAAIESELEVEARLEEHEKASIRRLAPGPTGTPLASDEFANVGEFLQAVAVASDPGTWGVRLGAAKRDMLMNKMASYNAAATGMSVGTPSDGGFLVRKDWSTAMLDRARDQAVLLPRCRNVPIGGEFDSLEYPYVDETSRATGSRWGGVQVYWISEAGTATAKAPKIGKGELRLEELMGLAYATERLVRDAAALESLLGGAFESEFGFVVDNAIIRGTGVGQPAGFFSPGAALVTVAKETAQVTDTVNVQNVLKMYARMPSRLKSGGIWLIHPDVMTQLPTLVIGQMPVWIPPGNLTQAPGGLLLGKPVVEIEQASELGKAGDIMFVNLNEYVVISKANEGLRYDTSMHVRFLNAEMAFRWMFRINGQPTWKQSVTPFTGALGNWSPFIALADRD